MLVFCAGMPKSGSTLQYNLAKAILGDRVEVDLGWVNERHFDRGFAPATVGPNGGDVIVKCHFPPDPVVAASRDDDVRLVSTARDLRDVAASALEFEDDRTFDDVLEVLGRITEVTDRLEGEDANCLVQRYESLVVDTELSVRVLASWLGVDPGAVDAPRIAATWSVEATRSRIGEAHSGVARVRRWAAQRLGRVVAPWDDDTLLWSNHISSSGGRPGRYAGILTDEQVRRIEFEFGDWLAAHGYPVG